MNVRPAKISDATLLFQWRNDAQTRAMSFSTVPVLWDDHIEWLTRRLEADTPHLYIVEIDGVPVGTFRIDGETINYTIAPEKRGNGYATLMLLQAYHLFGPKHAEIKSENLASICAAKKAGHYVRLSS
jgi:RimJ/RimL family protein N-acetyltransferase